MAVSAYLVISEEVENYIFRYNWSFRHTCMYYNSHWQSGGIIIFLWKYYIVISDKLVDAFLDVLFLLLAVILLELHEKPRKKDWVLQKSIWKNLPSFPCHFLLLSSSIKIHNIAIDCILRDDIMSKGSKIWKSLAI